MKTEGHSAGGGRAQTFLAVAGSPDLKLTFGPPPAATTVRPQACGHSAVQERARPLGALGREDPQRPHEARRQL